MNVGPVKMRDTQLSVAKGICIMLMVIGHSGCPQFIRHFIYMFHMPFFFMAAGYFMKPQESLHSYLNFSLKRVKKLYVPYLLCGFSLLIFHNLFYSIGFLSDTYSFKDFFWHASHMVFQMEKHEELFGAGWFFKDLLLSSVIVSAVISLSKRRLDRSILCVYILIFVSVSFICRRVGAFIPYLEMDLSRLLFDCTFILTGILLRYLKIDYAKKSILLISLILLMAFSCVVSKDIEILKYSACDQLPYFVGALSGILLILCVSYSLKSNRLLAYMGDNTIIILSLHFLVFKFVTLFVKVLFDLPSDSCLAFPVLDNANIMLWLVYSIFGIAIPIALSFVFGTLRNRITPVFNK